MEKCRQTNKRIICQFWTQRPETGVSRGHTFCVHFRSVRASRKHAPSRREDTCPPGERTRTEAVNQSLDCRARRESGPHLALRTALSCPHVRRCPTHTHTHRPQPGGERGTRTPECLVTYLNVTSAHSDRGSQTFFQPPVMHGTHLC